MKLTLLSLCLCAALTLKAQDTLVQKRIQVNPLPILLFNPFTGFGYGIVVNANYLLGDPSTTRFSNSQFLAMSTTQKQTAVQANHQIFLSGERFLWQGKLQYLDWPEFTYGMGANTEGTAPVKECISYKAIELEERIMWRIGKRKNFLGPQYRLFKSWHMSSDQPDSVSFFEKEAIGNKGYTASGVGAHFVHDSRDNVQNAYKGHYLELAANPFIKILGSTQNWTNFRVDYRYYRSLKAKVTRVIATRVLCEQATGQVPYMLTPMPGRYYATRGYVQGRYRGKTFASAECEYRSNLWRKLGYVLFSNVHTVSEPGGHVKYLNPALGAGLRMLINKAQRINIRMDYAKGMNDNGGLYFQVTEAF